MKRGDYATASAIWAAVEPLEDLRDAFGPISVLHDALTLTGIAEMGPLLPLVNNLAEEQRPAVLKAARALRAFNDSMGWEPVKATASSVVKKSLAFGSVYFFPVSIWPNRPLRRLGGPI